MRVILSILLVLPFGMMTSAQVAGTHNGLLVGVHQDDGHGWGYSMLFRLDAKNNPSGQGTGSPAWPYWSKHYGMTMDVDNRTVIVPAALDANNQRMALVRYDPQLPGIVGTLWSGAGSPHDWSNITLDANGDVVLFDRSTPTQPRIMILQRASSTWKARSVPTMANPGLGGLVWDKARGGFLHADGWINLYRTSYDLGITTLVAAAPGLTHLAHYGGDLAGNGDWISSSKNSSIVYYVAHGASSTATIGLKATGLAQWFDDVTMEKWAAPGDGFYATGTFVAGSTASGGVFYATRFPTASTVRFYNAASPRLSWPFFSTGLEIVPLYSRDLGTLRTGKAGWLLSINPGIPALAGKTYVVAASLTGARPPVQLPDGREIFLRPDALTALSMAGPVPPFLTGNNGSLGLRGSAIAHLDFSSVGTALNGAVIHFCGVVLDPAAPSGVAWVLEPWAFVVDVMP